MLLLHETDVLAHPLRSATSQSWMCLQVVMCSGVLKNGSLRVVRNGIGMIEQASVELPGIKGMWNLRATAMDAFDKYLMLSFVGETRILAINEDDELDEAEVAGFNQQSQVWQSHVHSCDCLADCTDRWMDDQGGQSFDLLKLIYSYHAGWPALSCSLGALCRRTSALCTAPKTQHVAGPAAWKFLHMPQYLFAQLGEWRCDEAAILSSCTGTGDSCVVSICAQTLCCANTVDDGLLQVTPQDVRVVDAAMGALVHQWTAPAGLHINTASASPTQVSFPSLLLFSGQPNHYNTAYPLPGACKMSILRWVDCRQHLGDRQPGCQPTSVPTVIV